jgi:hypothetical protein
MMLIAAMILGLIGGITYFVGGCVGVIGWEDGTAPWWMIMLVVIGPVGAMGAAMARTKPSLAGMVMLVAAAAALGVGLASYSDFQSHFGNTLNVSPELALPVHPFMGSLFSIPVPLLTLVIGGMLALSTGKTTAAED